MDNSLELKRYHIMEYLMKITDINLLNKVESIITENEIVSEKEMISRASIAEKQLLEGNYKTHDEAIDKFEKWMK